MDNLNRQTAILYIEPTGLFYYGGSSVLLQLPFTKEIVNDQEIISKEKFFQELQTFFSQHSISPSNFVIMISSNLIYKKDFPDNPAPKNEDIQNFLDSVPFEEVLSKVYKLNKKMEVVATNKQFCDEVERSLVQLQSKVIAIVPLNIIQEVIPELSQNLDLGIAFTKIETIKEYSFITFGEEVHKVLPEKKSERNRFYILLVVFGFLLVVLIVMIFTTFHK